MDTQEQKLEIMQSELSNEALARLKAEEIIPDRKVSLFSVKDVKANRHWTPFAQSQIGEAERYFEQMITGQLQGMPATVTQYPEDYECWKVGEYHEKYGKLIDIENVLIITGKQIVERKGK